MQLYPKLFSRRCNSIRVKYRKPTHQVSVANTLYHLLLYPPHWQTALNVRGTWPKWPSSCILFWHFPPPSYPHLLHQSRNTFHPHCAFMHVCENQNCVQRVISNSVTQNSLFTMFLTAQASQFFTGKTFTILITTSHARLSKQCFQFTELTSLQLI